MHFDPSLTITSWGPAEPEPAGSAPLPTASTGATDPQVVEAGVPSHAEVLTPAEESGAPAKPKRRSKAQQIRDSRVNPWQANQDPEAVRYFTPPWLIELIGSFFAQWTGDATVFDTDPAFDPEAFVQARHAYDIRTGQDGLVLPWWGSTFVNPPYDKPAPWLKKAATRYAVRQVPPNPNDRWDYLGRPHGVKWYGTDHPLPVDSTTPAWTPIPANSDGNWVDPMDGRAQTVMLVNVAPGTKAWQQYVFGCRDCLCLFLGKRVTFYKRGVGYEGPNNRDSALLYYGTNQAEFADKFGHLGTIVTAWDHQGVSKYRRVSGVDPTTPMLLFKHGSGLAPEIPSIGESRSTLLGVE